MGSMSKYFNGGSYVGKIERMPVRSYDPITLPDSSVWLMSGTVVPAAQSPLLAGNPAYRAVAPIVVTTPLNLNAANFKFFQGASASVGFYFNASTLTYMYTNNSGDAWSSGTITGLASFAFLGTRVNGASVEVYGIGPSNTLYKAIITAAAPETCTFVSTGLTISNGTGVASAGFAYDQVNDRYLICWMHSSSADTICYATKTGAGAWSESTATAAGVSWSSAVTRVAPKPGGGFVIFSSGSSTLKVYSSATGAAYTALASLGSVVPETKSNCFYVGSRLFFSSTGAIYYSDDNGVTINQITSINISILKFVATISALFGMHYDGVRMAFYVNFNGHNYICHSTNGASFSSVPYVNGGDSSQSNAAFFIGQKYFIPPNTGSQMRLFKTENTFTSNISTDYVGLPEYEPAGHNLSVFSTADHLRIA